MSDKEEHEQQKEEEQEETEEEEKNEEAEEETDEKPELESSRFGELPLTLDERLKKIDADEYLNRDPDDPKWFDRKYNRKQLGFAPNGPLWAAPTDARYQQIKMGRHCSDYYHDYFRCTTLLGEDHEPCKFFYNTYTDLCPASWLEKFDEWREAGVFPGRFDR